MCVLRQTRKHSCVQRVTNSRRDLLLPVPQLQEPGPSCGQASGGDLGALRNLGSPELPFEVLWPWKC